MSIVLAVAAAALFGIGTYLVLQRKLSRIIIGLGLLSHGGQRAADDVGSRRRRADHRRRRRGDIADPLPHALALTTIVITFGVSALLLALAFRSWILTRDDEVENDVADTLVARGGVESEGRQRRGAPPSARPSDEAAVAAGRRRPARLGTHGPASSPCRCCPADRRRAVASSSAGRAGPSAPSRSSP